MRSGCLGKSALQENNRGFVHLFFPELPLGSAPGGFVTSLHSGLTPGEGMELPRAPKPPGKTARGEAGEEARGGDTVDRVVAGAGGHQIPLCDKEKV